MARPGPFFILDGMKKPIDKCVYVLYGPTGVGKTETADLIGTIMPVEIINMDVGQLYEPLNIGTAKPNWRTAPITHHMFDVISRPEDFSCAAYRARAQQLVHDIWQRGATPLFVGGSGFYLRSLFFPPHDSEHVSNAEPLPYTNETDLWQELHTIDPERARAIPRNDVYRIKRALTLWHTTGVKPSKLSPTFKPLAPAVLLFLTRDRASLYDRINTRVDDMLRAGWIKEIEPLINTDWQLFIMRKKLIGYDNLLSFMTSDQSPAQWHQLIEDIKKRTRNYAKRQETYGRMLERELMAASIQYNWPINIHRLNLTSMDIDLYINELFTRTGAQTVIGKAQ